MSETHEMTGGSHHPFRVENVPGGSRNVQIRGPGTQNQGDGVAPPPWRGVLVSVWSPFFFPSRKSAIPAERPRQHLLFQGGIQMARIEESIAIRCPVGEVFALTTDAARWCTWHTAIPEAEQTSGGPVGVGTTFRGTTRLMGRSMPWTATATQYKVNEKFGKNIDSGSVVIEQHNTYTPTPEGTMFSMVYDMRFSGGMRVLSPLIVRSMRREMKNSLMKMKQILEE